MSTFDAGWSLQKAVYETLSGNVDVVAALGGAQIFDDVPRTATFPYVTFGRGDVRDWSTGSEAGHEHVLALNIWSRAGGRKEAVGVAEACSRALEAGPGPLEGHRLVLMRELGREIIREDDGETYRAVVRWRALTEVAD